MTSRSFLKVKAGMCQKIVERASPFFRGGQWDLPEAHLLSAVVALHLDDSIDLARRACGDDPAFSGFDYAHPVAHQSREIGGHLHYLGMDAEFATRVLRHLGVLAADSSDVLTSHAAHFSAQAVLNTTHQG